MKLTWLGHSAFRVEFSGAVVLIDPFLSQNPSFKGRVEEASRGVTHILLTHGHGDHLGDTIPIANATGAKVVANADLCGFLGHRGVSGLDPMNTGGTTDQGAFTVSFTQAHHSSATQTDDGVSHSLGNPNGLVIKAPGEKVLYHMGDTDIFGDMALVEEIHRPRIGIVPIGDRFTMGGRVAAMACRRYFHFDTVIPCHYATFGLLDQTADTFLASMGDQAGRVVVPKVGEVVTA
ncbi:MAG TPA: metal-dependent hydrolase [Methylomirabilota bacterium]|nr:metal-dependent hydrolase [Methylomirabilota bacterium]